MNLKSRSPENFLLLLAAASALAFATWKTLLNNFAIEHAAFTGVEIGILQSLREIPGFLAFTTILILLLLREQTFALLAVAVLALGVGLTGLLPSEYGLYFTTILMSVGFHYYYTLQQSLTLQWIPKERSPLVMGRLSATGSIASLLAFGAIWLGMQWLSIGYAWLYLLTGGLALLAVIFAWRLFPRFSHAVPQRKQLLLRKRYWLYYALTFMGGARRQIFIVFAGFLMVEKFGYSAADIALLFLLNHLANTWIAPRVGRLISRWGERPMLTLEYLGLMCIFTSYAFVETGWIAALLYILDHLLFAVAIAINSYFHKIADPTEIASTAGVSFTINHIAAVILPVVFGYIWIQSPASVFLAGTAMAGASLVLARLVPSVPAPGNEVVMPYRAEKATEHP